MTEQYAHLSPDTWKEAVNVMDRPLAPGCDIQVTRLEATSNHPCSQRETVKAAGIKPAKAGVALP